MVAHKILIIEDDRSMQSAIALTLPKEIMVSSAYSSAEARRLMEAQTFDLILLDLTLPDEDGMKLCSWIRSQERLRDVPIMLVTGRVGTDDKVMAFSLGADDYLVKPIETREFRARVLAKLKRSRQKNDADQFFCNGNIKFQIMSQRIFITGDGAPFAVETTPLEFRLLLLMAQHEERVFSREELLSMVWGQQINVLERTVDSHISDLRRKLRTATHSIKAVRGVGYQFVAKSPL